MKALIFVLFIKFHLLGQVQLSDNWLILNSTNSPLKANRIITFFEDSNKNYWVSSSDDNSNNFLQSFKNGNWIFYDSTNSPFNHNITVIDITEDKNGKILFGTLQNGLFIKNGEVWENINSSNSPLPDDFIYKVKVDKLNRYWFGIPNYGVCLFDKNSWEFFNYQNSFNGIDDLNFIEIDSLNNVWIGTDYFGLYLYDGSQWIESIHSDFIGGDSIKSIVAMAIDSENTKWAAINLFGGGNKIAKSVTDTSFVFYDNNDWNFSFSLFSYDGLTISKNNTKYFGTTEGLLTFNNSDWNFLNSSNSPIPGNWFNKGLTDSHDNIVYINSHFNSGNEQFNLLFYNPDSVTITSVSTDLLSTIEFNLLQNYPNPFNPSTSIEYRVTSNEYVSLKVFDLLGNEVATLVNESKLPGSYQVSFDASGLASGIYFYRLQTGSYSQSRKMIILK